VFFYDARVAEGLIDIFEADAAPRVKTTLDSWPGRGGFRKTPA
jgi:hypothetical protein